MKTQTVLDNLLDRNERILRVPLQVWMEFANGRIRGSLKGKFKKDITTELTDWEFIESKGAKTLKPASLKIMQTGGNVAYRQLAIVGSFDVLNVRAVKAAEKFCAKLVREVTANTKEGIRVFIREGVKAGKSMPKIAKELRPVIGLTEKQSLAISNYRKRLEAKEPKLTATQVDKKVTRQTNKAHRLRAENIARTETARAQNIGYCQGLEEVGVAEAEFRISAADYCEECEALDKTRYAVGEAGAVIPVHPRCRCAMLPVVDNKVISEQLKNPHPKLVKKKLAKIEPVEPPEELISLKRFTDENKDGEVAMAISQQLREFYFEQLTLRSFGEMENAVLTYDSTRYLAVIDGVMVGAVSFHYDELDELVYIDHTGTLDAPKGTGAELVRAVVGAASAFKVGINFEATLDSVGFWERLGFIPTKKVSYVFETSYKRIEQIKEALGTVGRVLDRIGVS